MSLTPDEREQRWQAYGEALLRLADASERPTVRGGHLYQLLAIPSFESPCLVSFDDQCDAVDVILVIFDPAAFEPLGRGQMEPPSAVQFYDVATLKDPWAAPVRQWAAMMDGRDRYRMDRDFRDGSVFLLRSAGVTTQWLLVDHTNLDHRSADRALLSSVGEMVLATFWREPTRSYLTKVLRPVLSRRQQV